MGSKASAPIIIRDQPVVACNMRDMSDWTTIGSTPVLAVLSVALVVFVVFGVLVCFMRRHYHRKLREYTQRMPRALDVEQYLLSTPYKPSGLLPNTSSST
jgi:hypothetical protein